MSTVTATGSYLAEKSVWVARGVPASEYGGHQIPRCTVLRTTAKAVCLRASLLRLPIRIRNVRTVRSASYTDCAVWSG